MAVTQTFLKSTPTEKSFRVKLLTRTSNNNQSPFIVCNLILLRLQVCIATKKSLDCHFSQLCFMRLKDGLQIHFRCLSTFFATFCTLVRGYKNISFVTHFLKSAKRHVPICFSANLNHTLDRDVCFSRLFVNDYYLESTKRHDPELLSLIRSQCYKTFCRVITPLEM